MDIEDQEVIMVIMSTDVVLVGLGKATVVDDASETSSLCSERAVEVTNAIIYFNNHVIFYMYLFYHRMSLIFYVECQVMSGLNEKTVLLVYII